MLIDNGNVSTSIFSFLKIKSMNLNLPLPVDNISNNALSDSALQKDNAEKTDRPLQFGNSKISLGSTTAGLVHPEIRKFSSDQRHPMGFITGIVNRDDHPNEEAKAAYQNYIKRITSIEQQKVSKMEQVQWSAESKQMSVQQGGIGASTRAVRGELQQMLQASISTIEKEAAHETLVATIEVTRALLPHQHAALNELLNQRAAHLGEHVDFSISPHQQEQELQKIEAIRKIIATAFERKKSALDAAGSESGQAREEDLHEALQNSFVADALCVTALNEDTDDYINEAASRLEQVDQSVSVIFNWTKENKFSVSKLLPRLDQILAQSKANFLLAEAVSPEIAAKVARANVANVRQEVVTLTKAIAQSEQSLKQAKPEDHVALTLNIEGLKKLQVAASLAATAYDQIAEEYSLKIEKRPDLNKELLKLRAVGNSKTEEADMATASSVQEDIFKDLLGLVELSPEVAESSARSFDLSILAQLDQVPEENQDHAIFGSKNKITIAPLSETSSDSNRAEFLHGIHLMRLALFRNFGIQGVRHFDLEFHDDMEAKNPLTVGKIKEFLSSENKKDPNSFYLSPVHSLSELEFQWKDPSNDSRVIRSEKISFNPFSSLQDFPQALLSQKQADQEGIKVTKRALQLFLKDLDEEQKKAILDRFESNFVKNKIPLTLGALKSFIAEKHPYGLFALSAPVKNNIIWHTFLAVYTGFKNTQWFLHSGIWPAMILSLVIGSIGDLTGRSRQLEGAVEEEEG